MDNQAIRHISTKVGAEGGLPMGLALSCLFLCVVYLQRDFSFLAMMALLVIVPAIAAWNVLRFNRLTEGDATMSRLWFVGTSTFLFGSILSTLVIVLWLTYVEPTFIHDQIVAALELYKSTPALKDSELTHMIQQIVDNHQLPSAFELSMNVSMWTIITGAFFSLLVAVIVTAVRKK